MPWLAWSPWPVPLNRARAQRWMEAPTEASWAEPGLAAEAGPAAKAGPVERADPGGLPTPRVAPGAVCPLEGKEAEARPACPVAEGFRERGEREE